MDRNQKFPGWAGPLVGPIAGAGVGYKVASDSDPSHFSVILIGSAAAGLVAGLIVWFMDRRKG